MARFTARAHGYGLVEWSADEVDAYACRLLQVHVPERRWVPHLHGSCRECGERWPCQAAAWAGQWSDSITRLEVQARF